MEYIIGVILLMLILILALLIFSYYRNRNRTIFIDDYEFPPGIAKRIKQKYDHLTDDDVFYILEGLKSFFIISLKAKGKMVAMPSQIIDIAWHEFILFTRNYQLFCHKGLGRFLHHTPTEAMKTPTSAQLGIKRAWRISCDLESIDPKMPRRLPLLFSIDKTLHIEDGFIYNINCFQKNSADYGKDFCASHIKCSSGCSGSSGCGGSYDCDNSSDSSGCSSGCGGGD